MVFADVLGFPPHGIAYFGITPLNRSQDLTSYRVFLVPLIEVVEAIYRNRKNGSEPVTDYAWPNADTGLRIRAIGRGKEEGLPITFTNDAMVVFTRWLGQIYKPYQWTHFQCNFGWLVDGMIRGFAVAEGNYSSFPTRIGPPSAV